MSIVQASLGTVKRGTRNVARNPIRLALIVALLGTGLMFVAAMFALNGSAQQRLQNARDEIGTGIDVRPTGSFGPIGDTSKSLTLAQLQAAEHVSGVVAAVESITKMYDQSNIKGSVQGQFQTAGPGGSSSGPKTPAPFIYGFTPGLSGYPLFTGSTAHVTSGRNLTASDSNVALTSQAMADANGWHLGSTFAIDGTTVTLVGIFDAGNQISNNAIIVPIKTARAIYNISGATALTVYASSDSAVNRVVNEIKQVLGSQFDVTSQASNYSDTLSALQSAQSNIETTLIAAITATALIIVFAVTLIVRERIQEIGLLKAIGATHWQVISQFGVEVLSLSGIAAAVAALLLVVLGPTLASKFDITPSSSNSPIVHRIGNGAEVAIGGPAGGASPLHSATQGLSAGLTPGTLALILAVGIGLAVLSSAVPAWYVARIKPADVLRAE
jgi:putative ABC transport system permease protein